MNGATADIYQTSDPARVPAIAQEHGFCLIKDFFTSTQMADFERAQLAISPADRACDFLTLGVFNELLFDARILAIARALLGEQLVYYGETNCMVDNTAPFRLWHFDARGMPENLAAAFEPAIGETFPGWRFALYFRDYAEASGGLKVGPGSHRRPTSDFDNVKAVTQVVKAQGVDLTVPMAPFPLYNVPSMRGDLVIFNLRTYHSAGYIRIAGAPETVLLPPIENSLLVQAPNLAVPEPRESRNALIFDLAGPKAAFDLYPKWRVGEFLRKEQPKDWSDKVRGSALGPSAYDQPDIAAVAERHGVTLRYDRIIGQLIWKKKRAADLFTAEDQQRLDHLLAINPEYSPHYPLRNFAA